MGGLEDVQNLSIMRLTPSVPGTGERLGLLATTTVNDGGWVDLPQPLIVQASEAFIAVPEQAG